MEKLDSIDRHILELLQEDAKINIKDLAKAVSLTKTPVYERIRRLEELKYIDKYVAILNPDKLNDSMVVFCSVSMESQKIEQIKAFSDAIKDIPQVIECYLLGGASDFIMKVVVRDLNAYHQFASGQLAALPYVAKIGSSFVLNEIKRSTIYPI